MNKSVRYLKSGRMEERGGYRRIVHGVLLLLMLLSSHTTQADEEHSPRRVRRALSSPHSTPRGTPLRVVTILAEPYTMMSEEGVRNSFQGYHGFVPDILRELQRRLDLNITIYAVPDGRYGAKQSDGTWNGMIGEVLKKQNGDPQGADLAAAPLTVTSVREAHIDFLKPFQHLGIVMVAKKPSAIQDQRGVWHYSFGVLSPLKAEVWAASIVSFFLVAVLLWLNNRYNPYEWESRYNIGRASESAAENFNLLGALWFTFSTLQWQGYERAPRSLSSRLLSCFWFVFVTLTLLTYTGSLVNHLFWASTVHGQNPDFHEITSLQDLVDNPEYDYGFVSGGSTMNHFLKIGDGPLYNKIREYIYSDRGAASLVKTTAEGFKKVRDSKDGKYVFFAEKTTAEFVIHRRPCDLIMVGGTLMQRSYGMAVPHNMNKTLSDALHGAILEMIEEGDIQAMENKWWFEMGECGLSSDQERLKQQSALFVNKPKRVDISMYSGPVILLAVGLILALLVAVGETIYYRFKGKHEAVNQPGGGGKLGLEEDA